MAYLDDTGLAYFWGKIKAWANSVFALLGHTHPSSDVTAMTGYSMPASSGAISSGDTLNQAVGKLEKAVTDADISNVVHKTGAETITGLKTVSITGSNPGLLIDNESIERAVVPNEEIFSSIRFRDTNNAELGKLEYGQRTSSGDNVNDIKLVCNSTTNAGDYTAMYLGYDWDGIPYLAAPSTSASRSSHGRDVVTRDWIPSDARIVHTTGSEVVDGGKTFTNSTTLFGSTSNSITQFVNDNATRRIWLRHDADALYFLKSSSAGVNSWTTDRPFTLNFNAEWIDTHYNIHIANLTFDSSTGLPASSNGKWIGCHDAGGNGTHGIIFHRSTNGSTTMYLRAHAPGANASNNYADLTIKYDENGNKYATCPTPASSANDTRIATTQWVNSKGYLTSHQSLSNYVTLNGNQTITGNKTFTGPIVITENNMRIDATSNKYIYTKFTNLSSNTSHASSNLDLQVGIQANNGNFIVRTYYAVLNNGDVRTMFAHDHTGSQSQFVFYSYSGKAEGYVTCSVDNKYRLGIANHRWSAVWAATATIQTSDERMKVDVAPVPDEVLDVWEDVEWRQFKFTDSVEEKGRGNARLHTGAVAQSIGRAFAAAGLDASRYGFFCYDSWDAKPASYDETGRVTDAGEEAGDRYSLRYEEALCIEAAYLRRENARLKKRVADLEDRLAALELRLGSE